MGLGEYGSNDEKKQQHAEGTHICREAQSEIGLTRFMVRLYRAHCSIQGVTQTLANGFVFLGSDFEHV